MLVMCDYLFQRVHDIESYTVNREYLVSKIFQIFAHVYVIIYEYRLFPNTRLFWNF